jgi:hypothetical protein
MSIELHVFAQNAVERERLTHALTARGWNARVVASELPHRGRHSGSIEDDLVLAWLPGATVPRDPARLDQLSVETHAAVPVRAGTPELDVLRMLAGEEPRLAEALVGVKHVYTVSTSRSRSELARTLQLAIWSALGELSGGVLYNEIDGEVISAAHGIGQVPSGRPSDVT